MSDEQVHVVSLSVTLILQSRTFSFNPKKKGKKEGPDHLNFIVACELPRNIARTIKRCRYGVGKSTKSICFFNLPVFSMQLLFFLS